MSSKMTRQRPRVSLRTVLIGINLTVLILPVAGIQLMRLYESALVRQTESALIAQAAFVAAFYRSLAMEQASQPRTALGREIQSVDQQWRDGRWSPRSPTLDLASSPLLPPFPDGVPGQAAEPFWRAVGERLVPVLKDAQLVTLAGIRVVDPRGTIVASTGDDVGLSIVGGEEIGNALTGTSSSRLRRKSTAVEVSALDSISRAGGVRVFVATPIVMQDRLLGAVLLSRTPPSIVQALYAKRWLLLQGLALLVVLVLVMSVLTFRFIARPISQLAEQATLISMGETSVVGAESTLQALKPHTLEIARLQEAITDMAATLEQRANYLQDFARHVSHEFKTPIASIRGAIEVLEDHGTDMGTTQSARFLRNIATDAERLHRLTQRLMELTQAEIQQSEPQPVELADMVAEAVARCVEHSPEVARRVSFDSQGVGERCLVLGRPEVLSAVLEILFENAILHQATIISLWTKAQEETVELFVEDDGEGISPRNRRRIFEPFFTTRRNQGGTGLGLTIATALLKQTDGELSLVGKIDGPTTFRISLPAVR